MSCSYFVMPRCTSNIPIPSYLAQGVRRAHSLSSFRAQLRAPPQEGCAKFTPSDNNVVSTLRLRNSAVSHGDHNRGLSCTCQVDDDKISGARPRSNVSVLRSETLFFRRCLCADGSTVVQMLRCPPRDVARVECSLCRVCVRAPASTLTPMETPDLAHGGILGGLRFNARGEEKTWVNVQGKKSGRRI
jgi:hypothetical protein